MTDHNQMDAEGENPIFDTVFPVWTIVNNLIKGDVGFVQGIEASTRQDDGGKTFLLFTDEDGANTYLEAKPDRAFFSSQRIHTLEDLIDICRVLESICDFKYVTIDFYRRATFRKFYAISHFLVYLKTKFNESK